MLTVTTSPVAQPAPWTGRLATLFQAQAACSNTDSNDVSIFDVKERRLLAQVKVGKVPKRLVIGTDPKAPVQ